jgi:diguanylate cyclase (GGDEF)-like protein
VGGRLQRFSASSARRWRHLGLGVRLFVPLLLALAVVGVVAYKVMSNRLYDQQIADYVRAQQADIRGFRAIAREYPERKAAIREIDGQLDDIGRRPGVGEIELIAPDGTIRAWNFEQLRDRTVSDPRVDAALRSGTAYAGRRTDQDADQRDFEFVTPVDLPYGTFALRMDFDSSRFDAEIADVRNGMLLVFGLALPAVALLFYLLGGRTLLRHHRLALERATLDGLTDLPNQRAFEEELGRSVAAADRAQEPLALALLDLDHFKLTNDRYGHPEGDAALRRVASVLCEGRANDRPYRIGGDEFAVLMPATDEPGAKVLLRRLSRNLREANVPVSIGLSTAREGHSAEELRAEADAALYEAKRRGGAGIVGFDEIRESVSVTTRAKREGVRTLLEERRLTTVFQPIWRFDSGELIGVEALSRPDPTYGLAGPAEAFDVAEQIGRTHELDELCATRALANAAGDLPAGVPLFVNVTPKSLELDSDGDDWLLRAAESAGLDPSRVVIEVTERMGARIVPVLTAIERLRRAGFKLALDDVGTGNAGLEMLRYVDADYVKIDRSIVAAAATEPNARAVLLAMATFARQTGSLVIAEGVEDEETLEFLRGIETVDVRPGKIIQAGQGFRLGYPSTEMPGTDPAARSASPGTLRTRA